MSTDSSIQSVQSEDRLFPPPADFAARMGTVHIPDMDAYRAMHERSIRDPESFWAEVARDFHWYKPWTKVLEWNLPDAKWFVGGTTKRYPGIAMNGRVGRHSCDDTSASHM